MTFMRRDAGRSCGALGIKGSADFSCAEGSRVSKKLGSHQMCQLGALKTTRIQHLYKMMQNFVQNDKTMAYRTSVEPTPRRRTEKHRRPISPLQALRHYNALNDAHGWLVAF